MGLEKIAQIISFVDDFFYGFDASRTEQGKENAMCLCRFIFFQRHQVAILPAI